MDSDRSHHKKKQDDLWYQAAQLKQFTNVKKKAKKDADDDGDNMNNYDNDNLFKKKKVDQNRVSILNEFKLDVGINSFRQNDGARASYRSTEEVMQEQIDGQADRLAD